MFGLKFDTSDVLGAFITPMLRSVVAFKTSPGVLARARGSNR